jgi:hypothetical protein
MKGFLAVLAWICIACASSSLSNLSCISERAKPLSLVDEGAWAIKLAESNGLDR